MNFKQLILEALNTSLTTNYFKVLVSKLDVKTYVIMSNDRRRDDVMYSIGCDDDKCGWSEIKFTAKLEHDRASYQMTVSDSQKRVLNDVHFSFKADDQHLRKYVDQNIREMVNMLYKVLHNESIPTVQQLQPSIKHFKTMQDYIESVSK